MWCGPDGEAGGRWDQRETSKMATRGTGSWGQVRGKQEGQAVGTSKGATSGS